MLDLEQFHSAFPIEVVDIQAFEGRARRQIRRDVLVFAPIDRLMVVERLELPSALLFGETI